MENNNAASMRAWLRRCPALARDRRFGADYLGEAESYSLDAVPTALKYRENILGDMKLRETQAQDFVFAAREPYGADFRRNLENLALMQAVAEWIIGRNDAGDFPEWEGGEVLAVVPMLNGFPVAMGSAYARYQMQIRVIYRVTRD